MEGRLNTQSIRQRNLRALSAIAGSNKALSVVTGLHLSWFSQALSIPSGRDILDRHARQIEQSLNLEPLSLDNPDFNIATSREILSAILFVPTAERGGKYTPGKEQSLDNPGSLQQIAQVIIPRTRLAGFDARMLESAETEDSLTIFRIETLNELVFTHKYRQSWIEEHAKVAHDHRGRYATTIDICVRDEDHNPYLVIQLLEEDISQEELEQIERRSLETDILISGAKYGAVIAHHGDKLVLENTEGTFERISDIPNGHYCEGLVKELTFPFHGIFHNLPENIYDICSSGMECYLHDERLEPSDDGIKEIIKGICEWAGIRPEIDGNTFSTQNSTFELKKEGDRGYTLSCFS